jgi:RecB family exonuclease
MKFLEEIADIVISRYQEKSDEVTIVFPNRRAGLFFRKYLSERISKPIWSPKIISIEDFIKGLSGLESADKLDMVFELYQVFSRLNKADEDFDKFYYWGNILLQDFDELDKFLVDARLLFQNLVHIKNLEGSLDFLQEDQKALIISFWKSFGDKLSNQQKGFLGIWDNLHQTYLQFKAKLQERNVGYDGMIYRKVIEELEQGKLDLEEGKVIFAGFNALSKSEEAMITWFVKEEKGEVYWDADDYYFKDQKQEAGKFLRELKYSNPILRDTFRKSYDNKILAAAKKIEVVSVASEVGQAQEASAILKASELPVDENTAIILPNNTLLFPMLHAMPENVSELNITMGYPLASSTIYGLLDALINLQLRAEGKTVFHFRTVMAVLKHPLFVPFHDEQIIESVSSIQKNNMLWVSRKKLNTGHPLLSNIFGPIETGISGYLIAIVRLLAERTDDEVTREFAFHFYKMLNRLNEFIEQNKLKISIAAYQKLFRQLAQAERLPFEGEPLLGLQVMGILESRNLDFDNVIVLSMNEGLIPPTPKNTSFIPYSIRKVFGLPVVDQQDAMYSYIFYRLVQRASNIHFIYNSTEETGKSGEVSRFVRQLEHESNIEIVHRTVANEVIVEDPNVISIRKDDEIMAKLLTFTSTSGYQKRFTPTAINTYLDCRLRFYFKYVLELYEQEEMAEEVDPMVFGNILHHVMEQLYLPFDRDGHRQVTEGDIEKIGLGVDSEIKKEFSRQFGAEEKEFLFEGQNVLAREIIKKMILKVLEFDKSQVPFEILGLEADSKKGYFFNVAISLAGNPIEVGIKGIIDRIEKTGSHARIVDYKTGKDEQSFSDIQSLFDRENTSRNKAVLQTFIYGLLYLNAPIAQANLPIQAALFNIRDLFRSDFSPVIRMGKGNSKKEIIDIKPLLDDFTVRLQALLEEIYDVHALFDQTADLKKCAYCPYSGMCNR